MRQAIQLTSYIALHKLAHFIFVLLIIEKVLGSLEVPERLMHMTTTAGEVLADLCHESSDDAVLIGYLLDSGFE